MTMRPIKTSHLQELSKQPEQRRWFCLGWVVFFLLTTAAHSQQRGSSPKAHMDPSLNSKLTISKEFKLVKGGFDVEWTLQNQTKENQPIPSIDIGPFATGPEIDWMDFTIDGGEQKSKWAQNTIAASSAYPRWLYSPVIVASNERDTIGCALLFPILDYKHDVACSIETTDKKNEWLFRFSFNNNDRPRGTPKLIYPGIMTPGSKRTYAISVRTTNDHAAYIETLAPYQDYFQRTYGGVRYKRDARPVRGEHLALTSQITAENPSGFILPHDSRPDLVGYGPLARRVERLLRSWTRVVLWAPTGSNAATNYNFPFQITSRWVDDDVNSKAMNNAVAQLADIQVPPNEAWGLWWGHSLEYQADWNAPDVTSLDLNAPIQVQAAFDELDRAVSAGATIMGLDAFSHRHMPAWESYDWLLRMQQRQKSVTFVTEGCSVDMMHTLAPTWINTYAANSLPEHRRRQITQSHALADLLLPGHEIWAGMLFNRLNANAETELALSLMRQEIVRIAQLGYVPVIFVEAARPVQTLRAAESWLKEPQTKQPRPASTPPAQGTDSSP